MKKIKVGKNSNILKEGMVESKPGMNGTNWDKITAKISRHGTVTLREDGELIAIPTWHEIVQKFKEE